MKLLAASLLIVASTVALSASAQGQTGSGLTLDAAVGFTVLHTNEGPALCGCFYSKGGSGEFSMKNSKNVSFVTEVTGTTTENTTIQQYLTIYTGMEGVRYSLDRGHKLVPFGEAFLGISHTSSDYVIYRDTTTVGVQAGGGLDLNVSRRFALRLAQVDYLFGSAPNGQNNLQNDVRYNAGIVFHLNPSSR